MKKTRKVLVLVLCSIIIIINVVLGIVFLSNKPVDIYGVNWDGFQKEIYIGQANVKEYSASGKYGSYFVATNEKQVNSLISSSEDYVGESTFSIMHTTYDGYLFFKDNAYQFLYYNNGAYYLKPLYTTYKEIEVIDISFPSMGSTVIIGETQSYAYQKVYGNLTTPNEMIFFEFDFDKAAKFYNRFDEYYATVDYENHTINIRAYNNSVDVGCCSDSLCVTLNFNDNTLSIYNEKTSIQKVIAE